MKTRLLTLAVLAGAMSAVAQGKITFWNDSSRLFVFHPTMILPADAAYAGQPIPASPLPSGKTLQALFYAGTNASSLTLQKVVVLNAASLQSPGLMAAPTSTIMSDVPGGSLAYFKVLWADTDSVAPGAMDGNIPSGNYFPSSFYFASSELFSAVPGAGIPYPSLYQTTAPVNSTWQVGNIVNVLVPEPSSFAICVLVAGVLCFRHRK